MQTGSDFRLTDQAKYAITFVSLDRFQQCFGFCFFLFCFIYHLSSKVQKFINTLQNCMLFSICAFLSCFPLDSWSEKCWHILSRECLVFSCSVTISLVTQIHDRLNQTFIFVPVLVLALFLNYNLHSLHDCLLEIFHNNTKMHSKVYQNSWNFSLCKFDCQTVEG